MVTWKRPRELFTQVRITRASLCAKNDPIERGRLVIKKKKGESL